MFVCDAFTYSPNLSLRFYICLITDGRWVLHEDDGSQGKLKTGFAQLSSTSDLLEIL